MNPGPYLFWITSRAAGSAAMLLASVSVGLGLMMAARLSKPNLQDLRAVHEALSLTTLGLVLLHGVALLGDGWLHPGLTGIAIPFDGAYRPLWTGIGIIAAYGLAALGISYYFRRRLGAARWRRAHRMTAVFWLLAIVHTIGAGTDATEWWFLILGAVVVVPAILLLALRWMGKQGEGGTPNRSLAAR